MGNIFNLIIQADAAKEITSSLEKVSESLVKGAELHGSIAAEQLTQGFIIASETFAKSLGTTIGKSLGDSLRKGVLVLSGVIALGVVIYGYQSYKEHITEKKFEGVAQAFATLIQRAIENQQPPQVDVLPDVNEE